MRNAAEGSSATWRLNASCGGGIEGAAEVRASPDLPAVVRAVSPARRNEFTDARAATPALQMPTELWAWGAVVASQPLTIWPMQCWNGLVNPFLYRLIARAGLLRMPCATAVCMLVAAVIFSCGAGPADDPTTCYTEVLVRPDWKPIDGDKPTMAKLGHEAMEAIGYEEIINRAEDAGWVKTVRIDQAQTPARKVLIADGTAVAADQLIKVFTRYAFAAGVTSQADSPVPGPADAVAVGILVIGLIHVGILKTEEILAAQQAQATTAAGATVGAAAAAATPTAKPTTTTTAPPLPLGQTRESCPPCKTVSGRIVPVGTMSYRPLDTPAKPQHGVIGPHYNIYRANQAPSTSPLPCRCFWQPIGAVSPADLSIDAIPIEPFANPGG
ncbi:MAG: hypothetical protein IPM54_12320 [Polyangiaceae bacterium]|nr:hypothetical protein [Polyangiaceae bacterium]